MKYNAKKMIALILIVVICAGATVTGFAVSAASQTNIAAQNGAPAALRDGVWQAVYQEGRNELFFIDSGERSFSLINPEYGIGVPSQYEYDGSSGIYTMKIGYEGNVEEWIAIDSSDAAATVCDANGSVINLYYICDSDICGFDYYTLSELREAAMERFEAQNGSLDGVECTADMKSDGSFCADVTVTSNGRTLARYTVSMLTAEGTDDNGEPVDLSR